MSLDTDPRWRRFNDRASPCPCCGRTFNGVFDLGYDHPNPWPHGNRAASGQEMLAHGEDMLTPDYCVLGDRYFLRCILPIPIIGTTDRFAFGPWGSVSEDSFKAYTAHERDRANSTFKGCFSWLSNILPGTGMTEFLPCDLYPHEDADMRPILMAHDGHPLANWQDTGITFDQLLDIYAAAGNDLRPHLMDA